MSNIQLYFSGDHYFSNILVDIRNAKSEICVESYIFNLDSIGLEIYQSLKEAKQRGVSIKILVDGVGSYNWISQLRKKCEVDNFLLRVYHPMPFEFSLLQKISWKNLRRYLYLFKRINKRNHRKLILIDNNIAYLGSFNVSQVHSEKFMGKKAWRDTGLKYTAKQNDTDFKTLIQSFRNSWLRSRKVLTTDKGSFFRRFKYIRIPQSDVFRINSNPYLRFKLLRTTYAKITTARNRILITNAYFLPRMKMIRLLKRAARNGTTVHLCLPSTSDVWFVREASRFLYTNLLKSGVKIFEYQPSVLHAKSLIIDDWASIGSHNLNHRSIMHDLEIETSITEPTLIQAIVSQWNTDINNCREVSLNDLNNQSFIRNFVGRIIYMFRYWI